VTHRRLAQARAAGTLATARRGADRLEPTLKKRGATSFGRRAGNAIANFETCVQPRPLSDTIADAIADTTASAPCHAFVYAGPHHPQPIQMAMPNAPSVPSAVAHPAAPSASDISLASAPCCTPACNTRQACAGAHRMRPLGRSGHPSHHSVLSSTGRRNAWRTTPGIKRGAPAG